MPILSPRTMGILLTTIGFIIATLAGLWLATQVPTLGVSGVLAGGGIAFVVAGIPLFAGVYLYARSATTAQELNTEMIHQRKLMELLPSQSPISVAQLATQLHIPEAEVADILAGLGRLQVFTGYITPTGIVQRLEAAVLPALSQCQHCGAALTIPTVPTVCTQCGTAYYPPESPQKWGQVSG